MWESGRRKPPHFPRPPQGDDVEVGLQAGVRQPMEVNQLVLGVVPHLHLAHRNAPLAMVYKYLNSFANSLLSNKVLR